jgi:hypothetical protein
MKAVVNSASFRTENTGVTGTPDCSVKHSDEGNFVSALCNEYYTIAAAGLLGEIRGNCFLFVPYCVSANERHNPQ